MGFGCISKKCEKELEFIIYRVSFERKEERTEWTASACEPSSFVRLPHLYKGPRAVLASTAIVFRLLTLMVMDGCRYSERNEFDVIPSNVCWFCSLRHVSSAITMSHPNSVMYTVP